MIIFFFQSKQLKLNLKSTRLRFVKDYISDIASIVLQI